ncbi:hypothetical protein LCGC14_2161830 [marine sediment metagenome]|uniref:Uncharacterized protein n=1 Tax=marine sediment metagenome TaxID=412755 RepID=A0A0F9DSI4_9ZZZZ
MKKDLEELIAKHKEELEEVLRRGPKVIREVAGIIRSGDLKKFRKFLRRHNIVIMNDDAASFRDYLILRRIDLRDLEPEARVRLRTGTLANQDPTQVTDDYLQGTLSPGIDLHCRDCKWFVTAPNDDAGENHDKSCVTMGTKGIDKACFGFIWNPTQAK